jgi:hypothetical protein
MHRFRWLCMIIGCLFSGKSKDPLAPVSSIFWITPFDVEFASAYSHTFFSFQALGRWKYTIKNFPMRRFFREKWSPYTYAEIIRFQRTMKLFSKVQSITRVYYWDEKMVYFEHKLLVNSELVARGFSRGAYHNSKGRINPYDFINLGPYKGDIPDVVVDWCKTDNAIKEEI